MQFITTGGTIHISAAGTALYMGDLASTNYLGGGMGVGELEPGTPGPSFVMPRAGHTTTEKREKIVMIRCRYCGVKNSDISAYCVGCGGPQ